MTLDTLPLPATLEEITAEAELINESLVRRQQFNYVIPAYRPLLTAARYKGAHGGRGGAKSHFFAEQIIKKCAIEKHKVVCLREVQKTLAQSVKALLESKIEKFKLGHKFRITREAIYPSTGGLVSFNGMQNHTAESIKSLEGFDIAWFEEAQSCSQRSLDLLRPTIREENSELWFSWNPRYPTDPIDVLLRSGELPPGAVVIQSNYKDNPYFPEVLRKEMEYDQRRDSEKYEHIWLGAYEQHAEARVFKNFRIEEFETPEDTFFYYGCDWGFSIDPSVMVRCWVNDRTLYVDREVYEIGVEIDHLPAFFDKLDNAKAREWISTADSARPETISYMQRHGYPRMDAAVKGKDSVKEGVIFLQGFDIVIHPRCVQTATEFRLYSYKKDKLTDKVTPLLEDKKNHVIDSIRYAIEKLRVEAEWLTF